MRLLMIADLMGQPGRRAVRALLSDLRRQRSIDVILANAENSAGGTGFTGEIAAELFGQGVDVLTGGNHSWDNKDGAAYLDAATHAIRPANYPPGNTGRGSVALPLRGGAELLVINLQGRLFLPPIDCPFRCADALLADWKDRGPVVIDFHAEATSEKAALAHHLDGRASAVLGTHTHVQTADARVLPRGTAFITDAGMTGSHAGIIGVEVESALRRFLMQNGRRLEVCHGRVRLQGAIVTIDEGSGRALDIEAVDLPLEE